MLPRLLRFIAAFGIYFACWISWFTLTGDDHYGIGAMIFLALHFVAGFLLSLAAVITIGVTKRHYTSILSFLALIFGTMQMIFIALVIAEQQQEHHPHYEMGPVIFVAMAFAVYIVHVLFMFLGKRKEKTVS